MTQYTLRVIIYVADGLQPVANGMAGALGEHENDAMSFGDATWQAGENLFAVLAPQVMETFPDRAAQAVEASGLGGVVAIDNDAAPVPGKITVHIHPATAAVRGLVAAQGLEPIPTGGEDE